MIRVRRRSKNFWRKEIQRGIREYDEEQRERRWSRKRERLIDAIRVRRLAAAIIVRHLSLPSCPAACPPVHRWRLDQPAQPS
jgi:hypothetical protein